MLWLVLLPGFYLAFVLPIASFRLLHRPRFPAACFGAIGICLLLPLYESYLFLKPSGTILDLIEVWFWLAASIPTLLILLILSFLPGKAQVEDHQDSDRFGGMSFRETFLGRSNGEKSKEP